MSDSSESGANLSARVICHWAVVAVAGVYLILVLAGQVPEANRLQTAEMGLLVFLIIMTSELIESLADISFGSVKARFRQVEKRQDKQASDIRSLQVAVNGIVTADELSKLAGLSRDGAFMCYYKDDLMTELKRLRSMRFIKNRDGTGIRTLVREFKDRDRQFDLKEHFFITNEGNEYLRLREELLEQNGDEAERDEK